MDFEVGCALCLEKAELCQHKQRAGSQSELQTLCSLASLGKRVINLW